MPTVSRSCESRVKRSSGAGLDSGRSHWVDRFSTGVGARERVGTERYIPGRPWTPRPSLRCVVLLQTADELVFLTTPRELAILAQFLQLCHLEARTVQVVSVDFRDKAERDDLLII